MEVEGVGEIYNIHIHWHPPAIYLCVLSSFYLLLLALIVWLEEPSAHSLEHCSWKFEVLEWL